MAFQGRGIYHISHVNGTLKIGLMAGSPNNGTSVIAWAADNDCDDYMWLVEPVVNEIDTFTIRNLFAGTYMTMNDTPVKGTSIFGHENIESDNQKWIIKSAETVNDTSKTYVSCILQNKATKTFIAHDGKPDTGHHLGTKSSNSGTATTAENQKWNFERLSRTSDEIHDQVKADPTMHGQYKGYQSDGVYLILPKARLYEIWQDNGLQHNVWRSEIFDCDDFAFDYKVAVSKWAAKNFKADGFAVLCGVMFGINAKNEAHAYNWSLDPKNSGKVVFIEPQEGKFSSNAFGYQGYFGLF